MFTLWTAWHSAGSWFLRPSWTFVLIQRSSFTPIFTDKKNSESLLNPLTTCGAAVAPFPPRRPETQEWVLFCQTYSILHVIIDRYYTKSHTWARSLDTFPKLLFFPLALLPFILIWLENPPVPTLKTFPTSYWTVRPDRKPRPDAVHICFPLAQHCHPILPFSLPRLWSVKTT